MDVTVAIAAFCSAVLVTSALVRRLLPWLEGRRMLAMPTDRSSHTQPTPCGGGLGVLAVLIPMLWIAGSYDDHAPWRLCAVACTG